MLLFFSTESRRVLEAGKRKERNWPRSFASNAVIFLPSVIRNGTPVTGFESA